jgi:hypothetical protein
MKKQENKKIYTGSTPGTSGKPEAMVEVTPPPLKDQLVSFAKSFSGWIADGGKVVTPKVYMERLTLCHTCDSYNEKKDRCNECGCKMQLKARMCTSECPLSKWSADVKK